MTAYTRAGQWGPEAVIDQVGDVQPGAAASVFLADGVTLATLYTDATKATIAANPFAADANGNLTFFVDPGSYVLSVTVLGVATPLNITVPVNPAETITTGVVIAALVHNTPSAAAANATAIQAALDTGKNNIFLPHGIWYYDTTLKVHDNQRLFGLGIGAATSNLEQTILIYTGANATNGIERKTAGASRIKLDGFRIQDGRTAPTSGSGIYLDEVKNDVQIKNVESFSFPTYAIAVVAASNHTSDCVRIEDVWVGAGIYGVHVDRVENSCIIENVKGDSIAASGGTMQALINIERSNGAGGAFVVSGAKLETNTATHMVRTGAQLQGSLEVTGLVMRGPTAGLGGDMLNLNNTSPVAVTAAAFTSTPSSGVGVVAASMVNDVVNGITYNAGGARLSLWTNEIAYLTGGLRLRVNSYTPTTVATTLDREHTALFDMSSATGSGLTVIPPTAVGIAGRQYTIKNVGASGTATINPNSTETIDGALTVLLLTKEWVTIESDGTNWQVVAQSSKVSTAYAASNETPVNNSSVLVSTALSVPVVANGVYAIEASVRADAATTADLKIGWSVPSGATGHWSSGGVSSGAASATASHNDADVSITSTDVVGGVGVGTIIRFTPSGQLKVGATGGSLVLQYAQNSAEATNATIYADSWLKLTRLA